jgi:AcrR family transcriptional regulator
LRSPDLKPKKSAKSRASDVRSPGRKQRPGGRTERIRKQAAKAALELIHSGSIDFNYQDLADRSGVSKVTLYRRWPKPADLVREAIKEHNALLKLPKPKSWSGDVELFLRRLATFLAEPAELTMNIALIAHPTAEASALMKSQWEPVQQKIVGIAQAAQQKGELPKDIDPTALMLLLMSPILVMSILERGLMNRKMLRDVIDLAQRMRFVEA